MDERRFTPTERRILAILGDGLHHSKDELRECLNDDLALNGTVMAHISNIRKKLQLVGQDIVCVIPQGKRTGHYRQVRLLNRDGYR